MTKRTPFVVKARCILNGADTTALIFLKAAADAHDAMKRRVPPREREHLRIVECREATPG